MSRRLADITPGLARMLADCDVVAPSHAQEHIQCHTVRVPMRDGVELATDVYLPPRLPAPAVVTRTPYGRDNPKLLAACRAFAQQGYVAISQDCRGTGGSQPDVWDYYVFEPEDGFDLVEWVSRQPWFDGFIAGCGGSYAGQTQWCMAVHPRMSAIAPEVSGLGFATNTARLHMFLDSYARSIGNGRDQVSVPLAELEHQMREQTLAGGYFNEPLHAPFSEKLRVRFPMLQTLAPARAKQWLWERYCNLSCAQRTELIKDACEVSSVGIAEVESLGAVFGHRISHDAHTLPQADPADRCRVLHAPPLMITGWYDWGLNDALATWRMVQQEADPMLARRSRLVISPGAHSGPGYREGSESHPELRRSYRLENNIPLLLRWFAAVRSGDLEDWPKVVYYLMGQNDWLTADAWPPPEVRPLALYLKPQGGLSMHAPTSISVDCYTYDPNDPTPTLGGSILSNVVRPGSVDVSGLRDRADVLTYTSPPLRRALHIVGPLRMVLYAGSSALDTDFCARLSDVFPDGRAIQLQNGILRARYRGEEAALLEPGRVYRFEIDLWATANRFQAGHRLRVDISSADFPRFDRNTNLGGQHGPPVPALQTVYHGPDHPSHLMASVLGAAPDFEESR